jgi:hypothetical protein
MMQEVYRVSIAALGAVMDSEESMSPREVYHLYHVDNDAFHLRNRSPANVR